MNAAIRDADAVLVILDISGYTRFIHKRIVSLVHAETIISLLIEAVIDEASHPLQINKLEGDAAFLFADAAGDRTAAVHSVYSQLGKFFSAFRSRLDRIQLDRGNCRCDACANVGSLKLKAFVHVGEVVIKQVRQFEELAGEPVILLHRLMKNQIPAQQYLLMTEAFKQALGTLPAGLRQIDEAVDGLEPISIYWCGTEALPIDPPRVPAGGTGPRSPSSRLQHLPGASFAWWKRGLRRLFASNG